MVGSEYAIIIATYDITYCKVRIIVTQTSSPLSTSDSVNESLKLKVTETLKLSLRLFPVWFEVKLLNGKDIQLTWNWLWESDGSHGSLHFCAR